MANEHEPIQAKQQQQQTNKQKLSPYTKRFYLFFLLIVLSFVVVVDGARVCVCVCRLVAPRVSGSKSVLRHVVRLDRYTFGSFQ